MSVSNLTGTTWIFNDDLNITSNNTFLINFIDNDDVTYDALNPYVGTGLRLRYFTNYPDIFIITYATADGPESPDSQSWQNQSYKTITITGGQDVTNTNLISWLESNAKQITVTNLTGTTWSFNRLIPFDANYRENITYTINFQDGNSIEYNSLKFIYDGYTDIEILYGDGQTYSMALYLAYEPGGVIDIGPSWDSGTQVIKITGGQDVTNFNLISFLENNAKQLIEYKTDSVEIGSIADAIRAKGSTSASLVYPTGFVSAIEAIETGIDTSDATATASSILSGKTAYVNGSKITGNIPSQGAQTITPSTTNQTISSGRYLTGTQTIKGDANLVASNIAQGVSIFGVTGTHSGGGNTDAEDGIIARTISGVYENSRVTAIRSYAFFSCTSLTSVSFSACKIIGGYAFFYCPKLTSANFPVCLTIESYAFSGCASLTSISFPACVSIYAYAFGTCSNLTSINFPACKNISSSAFYYCSRLTSVSFPVCTSIGASAFGSCYSLTTISFPVCTFIGATAFYNCSRLTSVNFPVCTSIANSAFNSCANLTTVSLPSCTNIGTSAFGSCANLTTVSLPACKSIYSYAFNSCTNLTTARFPACTNINSFAFRYCYNLISLYLTGSSYVSLAASNAFSSTPIGGYSASAGKYGSIYVPASMLASYKTMTNWTYFSSRMKGV